MSAHLSVLLAQTVDLLAPATGDRILDVTLGLGGHARALLERTDPSGTMIGLDADGDNLSVAKANLSSFGDRAMLIHTNFSALPGCLPEDRRTFDVILGDLGLSSPHLDDATRGFSFRSDAPLDMRFDRSSGHTAAHLLAALDRLSLMKIFQDFGELRQSHRLADVIINKRKTDPVRTTFALKDAVLKAYGRKGQDLLPQVFQSVRIAVNEELPALEFFLHAAMTMLAPSGRLGVITFHSLEDRIVKNIFRNASTPEKDPITGAERKKAPFEFLTKKAIAPSEDEITQNPRSRSARLRAIRKVSQYTHQRF